MKAENIGWFFVYFKSEAAANRFMLDDTLEVSKNNFVSTTSFLAYANFIDRFKDDHVYVNMDDYFYLQDGIVLNCFEALSDKIVNSETKLFWKDFYGPFAGVKFDKRSKTIIAYTNQTGEKPVYYFSNEEYFMLSSSVYILSKILQKNNLQYTLNENTANFLLTYYHTLLDNTIISEVKRLRAGHYLVFEKNQLTIKSYKVFAHHIDETITENDAVEEIDRLFKRAVQYEFKKDVQYGYKHFVTLSGGLDSRMTCMVAHELGYVNMLAFHFSSANYFEESIARKIATDLSVGYIYRSLNDFETIYSLAELIKLNYGNAIYSGIGGSFWAYKNLYENNSRYGTVHTGQIGDVILGGSFLFSSLLTEPNDRKVESTILQPVKLDWSIYNNNEQKDIYERLFSGTLSAHQVTQHFTEETSPFLEPDFIDFCLSLPIQMRYKNNIYQKWILKKHPDAAKYIWEKTGKKIDAFSVDYINNVKTFMKNASYMQWLVKLYRYSRRRKILYKENMNPSAKWYLENADLRKFIDTYYINSITKTDRYPSVKIGCQKVFEQGSGREKLFVLTVLGVINQYF